MFEERWGEGWRNEMTYFSVSLTQSPDTPPGSGSTTPSQLWRSVQWNKLVHIHHSVDSGTGGWGVSVCREHPSSLHLRSPGSRRAHASICSISLSACIGALQHRRWKNPCFSLLLLLLLSLTHTHTLTHTRTVTHTLPLTQFLCPTAALLQLPSQWL